MHWTAQYNIAWYKLYVPSVLSFPLLRTARDDPVEDMRSAKLLNSETKVDEFLDKIIGQFGNSAGASTRLF